MRLLIILLLILCSFSARANSDGLHLQVAETTIDIGKKDLEEMQIFQLGKNFASAMLRLQPQTAARIHTLTEKNIGQQALWVWNGRVLCAQKLEAPLNEDIIVYHFTSFEAEDFAKSVGFLIK